MYFNSFAFLFFLTFALIGYYTLFRKFQWQFLLVCSFIFYAFSGWQNLVYITLTIGSVYFASRQMNRLLQRQKREIDDRRESLTKESIKAMKASTKAKRRKWLILGMGFNFGCLAVMKYTDFLLANINSAVGAFTGNEPFSLMHFLLPLGISFYTFQSMSYLIDAYRGESPETSENNIFRLALFISFFPQLIQGPISRFGDLKKTLFSRHEFSRENFHGGLFRALCGLFKKMVVADRLLIAVKALVGDTDAYQGVYVLFAMFFYAITLYCDFTGGIDITIGIGEMLGVKLKENFNRPFYSVSIADYWRRWHITMGTWFKDYLFYPISVSRPLLKLMKKAKVVLGENIGKRIPVYVSTIVVWFMTGLWHGASWNFIVWGLLNGFVIIISQELTPLYGSFHKAVPIGHTWGYKAFQVFRTFWLMCFIRTFDIYRDVGTTVRMYGSVFSKFDLGTFLSRGLGELGLTQWDYAAAGMGVVCLVAAGAFMHKRNFQFARLVSPVRYGVFTFLAFVLVIFGVYGIGYDASQFIYNQF